VSRIRLYRIEAIVLKRRDFGEADRILTLYTPDRGKTSAIAKGVRRIASRKSGHVELFTHTALLLAQGRNLDVVTQAEMIEPYRAVREDLIRTTYAYHIAELVDRLTEEGTPSPATFDLLRDALAALAEVDDPSLVARFFELRLLGLVGYRPQLFACVDCGADVEVAGNAFGPDAGGVLCAACAPRHPDAVPLSESTFRVLRFLQTREWAMVRQLDLTPTTRGSLERVMHAYIRHLLERDLNSVTFLKGLRRVAEPFGLHP
jgi:DNA repair protein RecO (recombination protein O)